MLEERTVRANGFVMEILFRPGEGYRLACLKGKDLLVEFRGTGRRHRRTVRGRETAYEFKSVEQLRYDFERDAEDAQRQG